MIKSKQIVFIIGIIVLGISLVVFLAFDKLEQPQKENSIKTELKNFNSPADKYELHEREQHCGSSEAKTNQYIKEFEIPTPCTQPLSITTDSKGKVWFTETNTGNIAKFDPQTETFTEYPNDMWSLNSASMMWGIAYTDDEEIWYTDDVYGALWKFSISDETYSKVEIKPKMNKSSPQKIGLYNDNFVINDFTGKQIVILNHEKLDNGKYTNSIISTPDGYFTSQAVVDKDENMWFVIWKYQEEVILVKTNTITQEITHHSLPNSIKAPNGVAIGPLGNIWIADTAGNSFYKFNPENKKTLEFVTSKPSVLTYGNASGLIKTPITRPYWNAFDSDGNMWFNQQTGNRLSVFNPSIESLVEYEIPSKNPKWSDCGEMTECGLSQSFGFTINEEQVWFTEWVENKIGVLDASISLPVSITTENNKIEINQGEEEKIFVNVEPKTYQNSEIKLFGNSNTSTINIESPITTISNEIISIPVIITVGNETSKGEYKILIGMQFDDVVVSSYITIIVGAM